jgi:hypothetical protein
VGPLAPLIEDARAFGARLRLDGVSAARAHSATQLALWTDGLQSEED